MEKHEINIEVHSMRYIYTALFYTHWVLGHIPRGGLMKNGAIVPHGCEPVYIFLILHGLRSEIKLNKFRNESLAMVL